MRRRRRNKSNCVEFCQISTYSSSGSCVGVCTLGTKQNSGGKFQKKSLYPSFMLIICFLKKNILFLSFNLNLFLTTTMVLANDIIFMLVSQMHNEFYLEKMHIVLIDLCKTTESFLMTGCEVYPQTMELLNHIMSPNLDE